MNNCSLTKSNDQKPSNIASEVGQPKSKKYRERRCLGETSPDPVRESASHTERKTWRTVARWRPRRRPLWRRWCQPNNWEKKRTVSFQHGAAEDQSKAVSRTTVNRREQNPAMNSVHWRKLILVLALVYTHWLKRRKVYPNRTNFGGSYNRGKKKPI